MYIHGCDEAKQNGRKEEKKESRKRTRIRARSSVLSINRLNCEWVFRTCTCLRNYALTSPNVAASIVVRDFLEFTILQDIIIMKRTVLVIACVLGFVLAGSPRLPRTSADQRGTRGASHNNTGATLQSSSRNLQRNRWEFREDVLASWFSFSFRFFFVRTQTSRVSFILREGWGTKWTIITDLL